MVRKSTHALRRFGSRSAMALALATGGMLSAAVLSAPAVAREDPEKKEANSSGFVSAYEPFGKIVNGEGDIAAAKAMVPAVQAAIENNADRTVFGNALIALGAKTQDQAIQRQGMEFLLNNGLATPAQAGQYHYYLGVWDNEAKNYAGARHHFEQAIAADYTERDPEVLIPDTYFNEGKTAEGLAYLSRLVEKRQSVGEKIPDSWFLRGLKVAYDAGLAAQINTYAARLVTNNATPDNWNQAITVVTASNPVDDNAALDILRLRRVTDTLADRQHYINYIDNAARSGLPQEVLDVLADGLAKGIYTPSDDFYTDRKATAETNLANDKVNADRLMAEARASATGITANGAGDLFFSLGSYNEAAEMYAVALEKGTRDRELTQTRMGIAQVLAGKFAEGKSTLDQVAGDRAGVAKIWAAYADTKSGA